MVKKQRKVLKKRNYQKVIMDRYYRPKVFRHRKRSLGAKDADQQIRDFYRGVD
jgi:hypothetical protein